jgi:molybdate transport system substrate-binding protein
MRAKSIVPKLVLALVLAALVVTRPGAAEELTISAAASLANVFQELGRDFVSRNPGVKPVFNFGASGALLQQFAHGAPVDVFASADQQTLDQAQSQGLVLAASRRNFVSNRLVLIVPEDSRPVLKTAADLKLPEVTRVAIGNPATVPVGRYAREGLTGLELWEALTPKLVLGESVRQVLDYVARGEVDAGVVFATDAASAHGKVRVVQEIKGTTPIVYPIALLAASRKQDLAQRFVAFVLSPAGQEVFRRYGFGAP